MIIKSGVGGMGGAPKCAAAGPCPACNGVPNHSWRRAFQSSDLQPLTQSLRGEVDPWETLPLNNSPLLTAPEIATLADVWFPHTFLMLLLAKWCFTWSPEGKSPMPPTLFLGGVGGTKNHSKTGPSQRGPKNKPRPAKNEYSGRLGSQNDSKMWSKRGSKEVLEGVFKKNVQISVLHTNSNTKPMSDTSKKHNCSTLFHTNNRSKHEHGRTITKIAIKTKTNKKKTR